MFLLETYEAKSQGGYYPNKIVEVVAEAKHVTEDEIYLHKIFGDILKNRDRVYTTKDRLEGNCYITSRSENVVRNIDKEIWTSTHTGRQWFQKR
jgi:hypothetical protein